MLTTLRKYTLLLIVILVPLTGFPQYHDGESIKNGPDVRLQQLLRSLKNTSAENAEMLPVYFNLMDDVQRALSQYHDFQHKDSILRLLSDTVVFRKTLNSLDSGYRILAPVIRSKMSKIELELYAGAAEKLALTDTAGAVRLLEKSLQYKPAFHPAWYELIRLHLSAERSEKAMDYFSLAIKRLDTVADPYYNRLYRETSPRVIDACIGKATLLTQAENYLASLDFLDKVYAFAILHKIPHGTEQVNQARKEARQGIYNSFVHIAFKAREARKWQLSADYYKKAMDYQQQYPSDIPVATSFDPGPRPVVVKENTERHRRHYTRHSKKRKREAHIPRIAKQKKATSQLATLSAPKVVSEAVMDTLAPAIDSVFIMAQSTAREEILRSTYDAYYIVWKNQLDSAGKILTNNLTQQSQYKLENDSSTQSALEELRKRILEKECFNLQSEYDNSLNRAINNCKRAEFILADDQLQRAGDILQSRKTCYWDDSLYQATVTKYRPAIVWSREKAAYESALRLKNYPEFLGLYEESLEIFETNKLEKFNLRQVPVKEFLLQQNDAGLIADMSLSLLENGQPEKGLDFMKILKDNGKSRTAFKNHLQKMGIVLSKTYPIKEDKPGWLKNYLHDRWFKSMTNSYLRACKRLPLPFLFL